jgi:hypothetical protein
MGRYRALTKYFLTATKTVKEVLVEIEGQRMTGWRRNKHSQVWRGGGKALPQSPPTLLRAARLFSVAQLPSQFNQFSHTRLCLLRSLLEKNISISCRLQAS